MFPCSACHRHLRELETSCPFCGAAQARASSPLAAAALIAATVLGSSACSSRPSSADATTTVSDESTESGTEATSTDTDTTTTTGDGDGDGDTTNDTQDTTLSFYAGPEDYAPLSECDMFAQDCPEAEKCVPLPSSDDEAEDHTCVPVMGDGMAGEPCVWGGPDAPTDDCDEDSFCFHTTLVDGELQGTCVAFCTGTLDDPICPAPTACFVDAIEQFAGCLSTCDPLMQDCPAGQMCGWWSGLQAGFACVVEPLDAAQNGEACEPVVNGCALGQICVGADALSGCVDTNCCTEYCDIGDPDFVCADPNLSCETFWDMEAPPGLDNVGVCTLAP